MQTTCKSDGVLPYKKVLNTNSMILLKSILKTIAKRMKMKRKKKKIEHMDGERLPYLL